eukprot:scaffold3808_cov112-Isochrysis_galbana.AAC.20
MFVFYPWLPAPACPVPRARGCGVAAGDRQPAISQPTRAHQPPANANRATAPHQPHTKLASGIAIFRFAHASEPSVLIHPSIDTTKSPAHRRLPRLTHRGTRTRTAGSAHCRSP